MAGVFADRMDQRRLMIACNVGNAVVFAAAASLLPALPGLLLLVATSSTLDTIFGPAGRKRDTGARRRGGPARGELLAWDRAQHAGGVLAAARWALRRDVVSGALVADAALVPVLAALLLRVLLLLPRSSGLRHGSGLLAIPVAGLAYVRRHAVARAVVVTLFLGVAFAGIDNVALVFLSREVLGAGPLGFGVVAAAFGVGMLVYSVARRTAAARSRGRSSSAAAPEAWVRSSRGWHRWRGSRRRPGRPAGPATARTTSRPTR